MTIAISTTETHNTTVVVELVDCESLYARLIALGETHMTAWLTVAAVCAGQIMPFNVINPETGEVENYKALPYVQ